MATKRVKSLGFETRSEFDSALDDVAAMSVSLRKMEADRDEELQAVQEAYNDDILDVKEKIKGLLAQAEKYALSHRAELLPVGKKSGETSLALFGFRTGNPTLALLNKKWTWEEVINALKSMSLSEFIVTKQAADKDALKAKLTDSELAAVGCRVAQSESFWVEPKLEEAKTLG
ncbi:MAG: host-nuclease inhibitor Gam family protein [Kiritimatiellales bacterium]|nr:host-nuclease inhibitor Gam family protein [Kiritimatiellales bacterium]